jgi:CYTH domain-containing protein
MDWFEIERKFLVSELPDNLENYQHDEIQQWYFVLEDNVEERIRHRWNRFYHTKKVWHWEVREEYESKITKEEFNLLWPKTEWKRIYKTRYIIPYNNLKIELDIYHNKLEWLIVCEVEFNNEEESKNFKIPNRFWPEITNNDNYKNRNLIFLDFDKINKIKN